MSADLLQVLRRHSKTAASAILGTVAIPIAITYWEFGKDAYVLPILVAVMLALWTYVGVTHPRVLSLAGALVAGPLRRHPLVGSAALTLAAAAVAGAVYVSWTTLLAVSRTHVTENAARGLAARAPELPPRLHQIYVRSDVGPVELSCDGHPIATLDPALPFTTLDVGEGEHLLSATAPGITRKKSFRVVKDEARYVWIILKNP